MTRSYMLNLEDHQWQQLLEVLQQQQYIPDEAAIELICKIKLMLSEREAGDLADVASDPELLKRLRHASAQTYHSKRRQRLQKLYLQSSDRTEETLTGAAGAVQTLTQPPAALNGNALNGSHSNGHGHNPPNQQALETIAMFANAVTQHLTQQQQKLGFTSSASKRVVYCTPFRGNLWYFLDEQERPAPIQASTLTCMAQYLEFRQDQRRRGIWLTQLHVLGDRPYCLQSDYDSPFSKSLLVALSGIEPEQLKQPITLEPTFYNGHDKLLCRVYSMGRPVVRPYDQNTSWREVTLQAVSNINQANGRSELQPSVA